ncbi:MAG TPA: hypothetical protein DCE42_05750 [Myxococcales bacterium]|nr:hypothetical protein [Deltaproteobacteria bacterium]MBU53579.1 hypothetical protein [Deltaproteobacteria bacterium]HAA54237.1 hypothetical protein [Myxococcales bacterium]|tara:strand:- start:15562 stop:15897 length:336 start_codon:yes stop_codon:yes gene_type:complete
MNQRTLEWGMIAIACLFTVVFAIVVIPPLLRDGDVFGAFAAGFVNPYSSGYATDALLCWLVLAVWVVHDRVMLSVRYGWLCLLLGIVPGVAVGLPLYIVIRSRQLTQSNTH